MQRDIWELWGTEKKAWADDLKERFQFEFIDLKKSENQTVGQMISHDASAVLAVVRYLKGSVMPEVKPDMK